MPQRSDARDNAIDTMTGLLQRQGYAATGLGEVLELSGSPKGSFYFHFPGGKEQLAAEAVALSGRRVLEVLTRVRASTTTPGSLVVGFAALEAKQLTRSGYELGCPVATVALELASRSDAVREAAAAAFGSWVDLIADVVAEFGREPARPLAEWVLATLGGQLGAWAAWRDSAVITSTAGLIAGVLDQPVGGGPRRRGRASR